jgi:hypothetical protein
MTTATVDWQAETLEARELVMPECAIGARHTAEIDSLQREMAGVHPRINREVQSLNARLDRVFGRLPAWATLLMTFMGGIIGALLKAIF